MLYLKKIIPLFSIFMAFTACKNGLNTKKMTESIKPSIHNLSFTSLNSDQKIVLSQFKGKKILIVNVASNCGFTPQYTGLEQLYKNHSQDLVVIGFPCNQFLFQENGSEEKIESFCQLNYGVSFPLSSKVKVKGLSKDPIYKWLTDKKLNGVKDNSVSWNFNKFLINEEGNLVKHFGSTDTPEQIEKEIFKAQ